jgi:hypothetical protein
MRPYATTQHANGRNAFGLFLTNLLTLPSPIFLKTCLFNPSMFNAIQLEVRTRISNGQIGLPPDIQDAFTRNANEMLSDVQLMDKFGNEILQHYKLDDVEDLGDWLELDDDDEMGELEDVEQLSQKRSEMAVHLSMESSRNIFCVL